MLPDIGEGPPRQKDGTDHTDISLRRVFNQDRQDTPQEVMVEYPEPTLTYAETSPLPNIGSKTRSGREVRKVQRLNL